MYHFLVQTSIGLRSIPCFSQKLFRAFAKADETEGSPLFQFFSALSDFFSNFFCLQRAPSIFFDILQQTGVSKRVSPFTFFGTRRLFQNSHFSSEVRFSQYIPTNIFFNTFRNFDVISGVKRYIRTSDVISEVICVLLRRRRRIDLSNS